MIHRHIMDLGEARDNEEIYVRYWEYFYVGECSGDVTIRFNNKRNDDFNPEEFDKISDLGGINFLLVTNTAQSGKELVIYYEEKRGRWYNKWI